VTLTGAVAAGGSLRHDHVVDASASTAPAGVNVALETTTRYYTMSARVRPFLVWIQSQNVGGARLSWSRTPGEDSLVELLVGSDPARTPRGVNRWGFIAERSIGRVAELVGIMTETDDAMIDRARTERSVETVNGRVYKTIQSVVRDGEATSTVGRLVVDDNLTYRHYRALLQRLPGSRRTVQRMKVEPETEPGFLTAVKSLVQERLVVPEGTAGRASRNPLRRQFVYAGATWELSLHDSGLLADVMVRQRRYGPAIQGEFKIRNMVTRKETTFRMLYAAGAKEPGTPLRIVYRPRWWIEIELVLVNGDEAERALALGPSTGPHVVPWQR